MRSGAVAIGAGAAYAALQWLGRTSGSTRAERSAALPGDEVVARPMIVTNHGRTIAAPPSAVWPWLVQMGWHRGGWYTARGVDRALFPANAPSANAIVAEWQHLRVGDWIPDGPPEAGCGFRVVTADPERTLVLYSTEHLPPGFAARFGAWLDWSWTFSVHDMGDGRSRFVLRSRIRLGPWWLAAAYRALLVPADHVMSRQMLRGIATRAERDGVARAELGLSDRRGGARGRVRRTASAAARRRRS